MRRPIAIVVVVSLLLAACAPRPAGTAGLRSCDDGGDGGVVIDGVCL